MHKGHIAYGTIVATGAVMNFSIGFIPDRVEVFNLTSRDQLDWQSTMSQGHALKTVAAGTRTAITTLGISRFNGVEGVSAPGFTLGTDSVNTAAGVLHWRAETNDA